MSRETLTTILAIVVALVWAITALFSIVIKDYTGLTIVTPVMLLVAGFLFGYKGGMGNGTAR